MHHVDIVKEAGSTGKGLETAVKALVAADDQQHLRARLEHVPKIHARNLIFAEGL